MLNSRLLIKVGDEKLFSKTGLSSENNLWMGFGLRTERLGRLSVAIHVFTQRLINPGLIFVTLRTKPFQ